MVDAGNIFGRSLAFPLRLDGEQRVAWSSASENIRESIQIILSTEPGERLMMPTFGAGLKQFLFEPNTVSTHRLIEESITQALQRWELRIQLSGVNIVIDEEDQTACWVFIRYSLVVNQQQDQLQLRVQLGA